MGKHRLPDLKEGPIYNAPEKRLVICSIHEIDTYDNQDVKKALKTFIFWLLQHEITDRGYTWDYYHKYYGPLRCCAVLRNSITLITRVA